jgi:hypothetical protein
MSLQRVGIGVLLAIMVLPSALAQEPAPPADVQSRNGHFYTVYAENMAGKDWTEKIQRAIDRAASWMCPKASGT